MSWKKATPIEVNTSSVVGLKAELSRKKEDFERQKALAAATGKSSVVREVKKNSGVKERAARDQQTLEKDAKTPDNIRLALERKAALYEKLKRGESVDEATEREARQEHLLIDFDAKVGIEKAVSSSSSVKPTVASAAAAAISEKNKSETNGDDQELVFLRKLPDGTVEYQDEFGRLRRTSETEWLAVRREWEQEKRRAEESKRRADMRDSEYIRNGPTHYAEVKEIRNLGVGHFKFAAEEQERQEQMRLLQEMRTQTVEERSKHQQMAQKRKEAMEERLAKVRERSKRARVANGDANSEGHNSASGSLAALAEDLLQSAIAEAAALQADQNAGSEKESLG